MPFFDPKRPCGTRSRAKNRYTRDDLEELAKDYEVKSKGMTMDEICKILGKKVKEGFIPLSERNREEIKRKGGKKPSKKGKEKEEKKPSKKTSKKATSPKKPEKGLKVKPKKGVKFASEEKQIKYISPKRKDFPAEVKKYIIVKTLGSGSFGTVYQVKFDKKVYALKEQLIQEDGLSPSELVEADILSRMTHENLIGVYRIFIDGSSVKSVGRESTKSIYYLLELADQAFDKYLKDTKDDYIINENKLPVDDYTRYAFQMFCGVAFLHSHGVIHSDLKPANMLLSNGVLKIADFGAAQKNIRQKRTGTVSTVVYEPPEVLMDSERYTQSVDTWALGITLYQMLYGKRPFDKEDYGKMISAIIATTGDPDDGWLYRHDVSDQWGDFIQTEMKKPKRDILSDLSSEEIETAEENFGEKYPLFVDLMKKCLVFSDIQRISDKDALNHPLFNEFGCPEGIYNTGYVLTRHLELDQEKELYDDLESSVEVENANTFVFAFDLFERYLSNDPDTVEKNPKLYLAAACSIAIKMNERYKFDETLAEFCDCDKKQLLQTEEEIATGLDFILYVDNLATTCEKDQDNELRFLERIRSDKNYENERRLLRERKFLELCPKVDEIGKIPIKKPLWAQTESVVPSS